MVKSLKIHVQELGNLIVNEVSSLKNGVLFMLAGVAWVACLRGWRVSVGGVSDAWVVCLRGRDGWHACVDGMLAWTHLWRACVGNVLA